MAGVNEEKATKVIIAMDGSWQAEQAFDWYFDHLYNDRTEVVALHCPGQPELPVMAFDTGVSLPSGDWDILLRDHRKNMKQLQDKYESKLKELKVPYKMRVETQMAGAGEAICKIAIEEAADMIFIGSRGMGMIRRTILGSVSDYVLHHAHVPVTVHHATKQQ